MVTRESVRRSVLWAAYGDVLGFITEFADKTAVRRRTGREEITSAIPWTRRVGGRFGISIELPAGCYSDDTQLRLATSRAIRSDGGFDVEAFAKVELPVWRSYALGGGRGTKSAARALAKANVQWCSNFFATKYSEYTSAGGNGAAMRIQPHVWAAPRDGDDTTVVRNIVRNAVTTHGHFRGIVGAIFHGLCLRHALLHREAPGPEEWMAITSKLESVPSVLHSDETLGTFWIPLWEEKSGREMSKAFEEARREVASDLLALRNMLGVASLRNEPHELYANAVTELGCFSKDRRGSGTKTAVLATFLAFLFSENPYACVQAAANMLGSDTDTIATMAGAIVGAASSVDVEGQVADSPYMKAEAERLYRISQRESVPNHPYPDLLFWRSPQRETDCVGKNSGHWVVAGLGKAVPCGQPYERKGKQRTFWQWYELDFGQRVLMKRRDNEVAIGDSLVPAQRAEETRSREQRTPSQGQLFGGSETRRIQRAELQRGTLSIDDATDIAIKSNFDSRTVGELLVAIAKGDNGVERATAFGAIVAKAIQARLKRGKNR